MSNAGLGLRNALDRESDELPRTQSRRAAAQAQAGARTARAGLTRAASTAAASTGVGSTAVRSTSARSAGARSSGFGHDMATARPHAPSAPGPARGYDYGRSRIDANGVRTVKIRGQATPPRRRPLVDVSRPIARYDQHPDRAAQWALFLGVFMVVVAIVTGS